MAIQSFSDADTEKFFLAGQLGKRVGWASVSRIARRKLDMLHYAIRLEDLSGDLKGYHSIRINEQWRIVFRWAHAGPYEVRITDYH